MALKFALMRVNKNAAMPRDPGRRAEFWERLNEALHRMLEDGTLKEAHLFVEGTGGYLIIGDNSPEKVFEAMNQAYPLVEFEIHEAIPLEKGLEIIAKRAEQSAERMREHVAV